mmetsp:Transcript_21773/g.63350  ORF Transcript_21773/g.63350 Transcript_21773/m.63350 type:complete len:274 (-) Transcript_21773:478-1299(-)
MLHYTGAWMFVGRCWELIAPHRPHGHSDLDRERGLRICHGDLVWALSGKTHEGNSNNVACGGSGELEDGSEALRWGEGETKAPARTLHHFVESNGPRLVGSCGVLLAQLPVGESLNLGIGETPERHGQGPRENQGHGPSVVDVLWMMSLLAFQPESADVPEGCHQEKQRVASNRGLAAGRAVNDASRNVGPDQLKGVKKRKHKTKGRFGEKSVAKCHELVGLVEARVEKYNEEAGHVLGAEEFQGLDELLPPRQRRDLRLHNHSRARLQVLRQ